jgi:hypothetical protein
MYYKWHKLPLKRRYEIVDGGNRSLLQFVGELSQISFPQEFLLILRNHVQMGMDLLILKTNESQLSQKLLLCPSGVSPSV